MPDYSATAYGVSANAFDHSANASDGSANAPNRSANVFDHSANVFDHSANVPDYPANASDQSANASGGSAIGLGHRQMPALMFIPGWTPIDRIPLAPHSPRHPTQPQPLLIPGNIMDPFLNPSTTEPVPQTEASAPTKGRRSYGAQNKAIESYMSDAQQALAIAMNDGEIRSALEAHGLDEAERATAIRLTQALRECFQARAKGMGAKTEVYADLTTTAEARRLEYCSFRDIARASYPGRAERQALSVTEKVPEEHSRLISVATASYQAAQDDLFLAKLAKRGYSKERLQGMLADLAALTRMAAERTDTHVEAQNHTVARDQAYAELKAFMKEWKGIARGALRTNPGALKKLGL